MSQVVIARPHRHADQRYELTEVAQLALEIQQAEGLDLDAALARAAEQLELLHSYAQGWDGLAVDAGTWDAVSSARAF